MPHAQARETNRSLSPKSPEYSPVVIRLVSSLFALSLACSGGPEPYKTSTPPKNDLSQLEQMQSNSMAFIDWSQIPLMPIDGGEEAEDEELRRRNSFLDIKYGEGIGHFTFETEYEDAKDKLNKPRGTGYQIYPSGFGIAWRAETPRKPRARMGFMVVKSLGFQGKMIFPEPIGPIQLDSVENNFEQYFTAEDPRGEGLAQMLYRKFHKVEDLSYNCLKTGECKAFSPDINDVFKVIQLPGATLVFSSEKPNSLFRIFLNRIIPHGRLAGSVDLAQGSFENADLTVGQNYENFLQRSSISEDEMKRLVPSTTGTNLFIRDFQQFVLGFKKNNHARGHREIQKSDRLRTFILTNSFSHPIRINGSYVEVTPNGNEVALSLKHEEPAQKNRLKMTMQLPESVALSFTKNFASLLESELLKNEVPGSLSYSQINNLHLKDKSRNYISTIMTWNPETAKGRWLNYVYQAKKGNITGIYHGLLDQGIDQITVPGIFEAPSGEGQHSATRSQDLFKLAGFQLGEQVAISEVDAKGRAEANFHFRRGDKVIKTRGSINLKANLAIPTLGEEGNYKDLQYRKVIGAGLGSIGPNVALTLKEVGRQKTPSGEEIIVGRITSINTPYLDKGIEICGQKVLLGESYQSLFDKVNQMAMDEPTLCQAHRLKRTDGSEKFSTYLFPHQGIAIVTDKAEVMSIGVFVDDRKLLEILTKESEAAAREANRHE